MTIRFLIILLMSLSALTSCSVFGPVNTKPQTNYVLNQLPSVPIKRPSPLTLYVAPPQTNSLYNTREMAYSTAHYQIGYYANHLWADQPSEMVQTLLVQTLQNTRHFHAVVTSGLEGNVTYILNTQIIKLLQDYTRAPGQFYLTVQVQILRASDNHIIATKEFSFSETIYQPGPYAGVVAANRATARALSAITRFCLIKI